MKTKFDVIVIGGGAGGLTCAIGAVKLGKKTLLIERRKIGGECTWSGCIPSKAFIQYSKKTWTDNNHVFQHVRNISEEIYQHETPEVLTSYGIHVIMGEASFQDEHHITVDNEIFYGEKIVITTGTSPTIPKIQGLTEKFLLTNDNFFLQDSLPKSVTFIGGGFISIELAIPLARLGVQVNILEFKDDILGIADTQIQKTVKKTLQHYNINLYTGSSISHCIEQDNQVTICFTQQEQDKELVSEKIFAAIGRSPNIEHLSLENAKVQYNDFGITVNDYLQTSQKHIYALGDVVGSYRFSHVAGMQGEVFVKNLISPFKQKYKSTVIPYIVFTEPEVAQIGLTEKDAITKYGKDHLQIYEYTQKDSERAVISLEENFYLKIINHNKLIIGATVIGERSGEIASLLQWFYGSKTSFTKFTTVMQAYPSYGDLLRKIAKRMMIDNILSHPLVKLFLKKS